MQQGIKSFYALKRSTTLFIGYNAVKYIITGSSAIPKGPTFLEDVLSSSVIPPLAVTIIQR